MNKLIDLTNREYGRLHVINRVGTNKNKHVIWKCTCSCGKTINVTSQNLRTGITKSCGCLHKDIVTKHNLSDTQLYNTWHNMKQRCYYQYSKYYKNYGGRGIKVCDEWRNNFKAFYDWAIENGYNSGLELDRIDNNGNYEPCNCRWASHTQQNNNKRNNTFITHDGVEQTITEWSRYLNIPRTTLYKRIYVLGWSVEKAFNTKIRRRK